MYIRTTDIEYLNKTPGVVWISGLSIVCRRSNDFKTFAGTYCVCVVMMAAIEMLNEILIILGTVRRGPLD